MCRGISRRAQQDSRFVEFAEVLAAEALSVADCMSDETDTLYIGGGTPSVLPLAAFRTLLDALRQAGHGGPYKEFTVEVNPEDIVEKGIPYVEGLLEMGVNRISMGVQSFDDDVLKFMNRRHDAVTARKAYALLEDAGVGNISIDLIFGLPQLSDKKWNDTLKRALEISPSGRLPEHVSSYQLSVDPESRLASLLENGQWAEAPDELCERQYDILCSTLRQAGYSHYEISNFARPGFEAVHNSAYWHHVPYVGLGPGAHSFLSDGSGYMRRWNRPDLDAYMAAGLSGDFSPVREGEILTSDQIAMEKIMLALRTSKGISESYLRMHSGHDAVEAAMKHGSLVSAGDGRLRIPESRFFVSDALIAELV